MIDNVYWRILNAIDRGSIIIECMLKTIDRGTVTVGSIKVKKQSMIPMTQDKWSVVFDRNIKRGSRKSIDKGSDHWRRIYGRSIRVEKQSMTPMTEDKWYVLFINSRTFDQRSKVIGTNSVVIGRSKMTSDRWLMNVGSTMTNSRTSIAMQNANYQWVNS